MPRNPKIKPGALSLEDKVYVAEHYVKHTPEWISKKIAKNVVTINKYIDKITDKEAIEKARLAEIERVVEETKKKMNVSMTEKTGVATVMTESGAGIPTRLNNRKSDFIKKK